MNERAYLITLHAQLASQGKRRNAKAIREVIAALDERDELRQRIAIMEMEETEGSHIKPQPKRGCAALAPKTKRAA